MRAVAISVWLFINLVFLGMCGYMYLLWRQYWLHAERQKLRLASLPTAPAYPYDVQYLDLVVQHGGGSVEQESRHSRRHLSNNSSSSQAQRHAKAANTMCRPGVERCEGEEDPLNGRRRTPSVVAHKSQLVVQLRRVLLDEASVFAHDRNVYDVQYSGSRGSYNKKPAKDVVCELKRSTNIRTLDVRDEPFASVGLGRLFPKQPLFAAQRKRNFASCAVVSSAGSLSDAQLGSFIDAHDVVVRFNHAPTENYEKDVGSKTTLRIINSQVVTKPEFDFLGSPMYRNVSLLAWDPCNYTSTLLRWYRKPDFDLFQPYFSRRREHPDEDLYLLDPRSAWPIWNFLQSHVPAKLRRNPPSSGFLGLALMLPVCSYVDMIEFVPSLRLSKRCHYFDVAEDSGCTFGSWHPLAAEKLVSLAMSSSDDNEIFGRGIVRIQGYNALRC